MPKPKQFKTHRAYLNWYRKYRERNRIKLRKYNRKYNKIWRKEHDYSTERNYEKSHPKRVKANRLLRKAVMLGFVKKQPCEVCKSKVFIHAHHDNYNKPLEVRWLCAKHHRWEHEKINENIIYGTDERTKKSVAERVQEEK